MTVFTYTATERRNNLGLAIGQGVAGRVVNLCSTQEVAPAESGTTISFGKIPSNARILGCSRVYYDDLATSGAPTLDIGLYSVNGNITSDADALTDGLTLATAVTYATALGLPKDFANAGKPAYLFVSGQTTDPGGVLEVKGIIVDAPTLTNTGTITVDLYYTVGD